MHTCVTLQTTPTGDTSASVTAIVALPTAKYDICSANMQQDPLHTSAPIVTVTTICSTAQCSAEMQHFYVLFKPDRQSRNTHWYHWHQYEAHRWPSALTSSTLKGLAGTC